MSVCFWLELFNDMMYFSMYLAIEAEWMSISLACIVICFPEVEAAVSAFGQITAAHLITFLFELHVGYCLRWSADLTSHLGPQGGNLVLRPTIPFHVGPQGGENPITSAL